MGFMDFLFGGTPEVTLPPAVKAEVAKLQMVPFGPERDQMIQQIQNTYGISADQLNQALGGLSGVLDTSESIYGNAGNNLQSIAQGMQRFAGNDAYMDFYGNPAAREQQMLAQLQEANRIAFDPYGVQGSESEMRKGLMSANQARRGITNSGVAARQMEQERMRMAAARAAADAGAIKDVRQQGLGEASAYQAAKSLASQNLNNSGDMQVNAAQVASMAPTQRIQAAQLYGNQADINANKILAAQSELRNAQQSVDSYNTEVQNKVNQDYASSQNQMNVNQANLDASRRKPGLMDFVAPIASLGMQAAGSFMGGGGASGALGSTLGNAGQALRNTNIYSGWNPSLPSSNFADYSRYGQRSGGFF